MVLNTVNIVMNLGFPKPRALLMALLLGHMAQPPALAANDKDVLLEMHNERRAMVGSRPLSWDDGLVTIAVAHAGQLAWWEGCGLRHIGLVPPAAAECLSRLSGDITDDDIRIGVQLWIDEGPGQGEAHGHYNVMHNNTYSRLGCSRQYGVRCWVLACLYGRDA